MSRALTGLRYEQGARVGKALASPKRPEIIELLALGEKTVNARAKETSIRIKRASAPLRVVKELRLVAGRTLSPNPLCLAA